MSKTISIGDTLYDVFEGIIEPQKVKEIVQTAEGKMFVTVGQMTEMTIPETAIGKDVFLDYPAACEYCRAQYGRVQTIVQNTPGDGDF